jgi:hypothetical protein
MAAQEKGLKNVLVSVVPAQQEDGRMGAMEVRCCYCIMNLYLQDIV